MTILEVIQKSSQFLAGKGVESPRLQVELLLAAQLGIPRLKLYLNHDQKLSETELGALRSKVVRRGAREPLQHIIGSVNFAGLEVESSRDALVPRPETELLASTALRHLAVPGDGGMDEPMRALDFGTGTGCLAIYLAIQNPGVEMHACDLSQAALGLASRNALRHGLADRIRFHHGDSFAALPGELRFNLIVSNPPYIPSLEIENLEPEVKDHDPRMALDGGKDGLTFYRLLASEAATWLKAGGVIAMEFGDGQEPAVRQILESQNWVVEPTLADYSSKPRVVVARRESQVRAG
ncbi:MAG: peptide chain release factor N(5)-glutamine methyltransferase [Verrucomicrobia bacterium]|nr:peptide chain release factor N(5)-glutamine methyltransferase [Verrucomicrobiota bacterium]